QRRRNQHEVRSAQHFAQLFGRQRHLPANGGHFHSERTRQPRRFAPNLAVADDPQHLAAHKLDVELVPLPRFLTAHQPSQAFGEKENGSHGEFRQRVLKNSSSIGQRYRTLDQFREEHLLHSGGNGVHPPHARSERQYQPQQISV